MEALEKSRSAGQQMTGTEQALRAARKKGGKLRSKLEHKADGREYACGRRSGLRFESAEGLRRMVTGELLSSKR